MVIRFLHDPKSWFSMPMPGGRSLQDNDNFIKFDGNLLTGILHKLVSSANLGSRIVIFEGFVFFFVFHFSLYMITVVSVCFCRRSATISFPLCLCVSSIYRMCMCSHLVSNRDFLNTSFWDLSFKAKCIISLYKWSSLGTPYPILALMYVKISTFWIM